MILSKRLQTIADWICGVNCAADIGTDHAYLPIALAQQDRAGHIIAMDVRQKPLIRAEKNICEAGVQGRIELRLSDGAEKLLPGEADIITISGMGGALMSRIISSRQEVFRSAKQLILSPQSEIRDFRCFLLENQYEIRDEKMVFEDGKYYFIMLVKPGADQPQKYEEFELHYSRQLPRRRDQTLYQFLCREQRIQREVMEKLSVLNTEASQRRMRECEESLNQIKCVLDYYEEL